MLKHISCAFPTFRRLISHKSAMVKYITGDVRSHISTNTIWIQIVEKPNQELAAIIKSDKVPLKDYLVVDVRDDDYAGGNILKGQNWPSHNFMWKVDELVEKTKDVKTVVFHCALSQIR